MFGIENIPIIFGVYEETDFKIIAFIYFNVYK